MYSRSSSLGSSSLDLPLDLPMSVVAWQAPNSIASTPFKPGGLLGGWAVFKASKKMTLVKPMYFFWPLLGGE